jgi:predicted nucleic acid-binding protein
MKRVLDSSIAFKWEVPESDTDKANHLRVDFRNGVCELIAPDFFPIELAHALTRAERQMRIAVGQASVFWADAMSTPPQLLSCDSLIARAIDLSSQVRIGVYDCLYVLLAEQEKCELVTADDKLIKALQGQFSFLVSLATLL